MQQQQLCTSSSIRTPSRGKDEKTQELGYYTGRLRCQATYVQFVDAVSLCHAAVSSAHCCMYTKPTKLCCHEITPSTQQKSEATVSHNFWVAMILTHNQVLLLATSILQSTTSELDLIGSSQQKKQAIVRASGWASAGWAWTR